MMYSETCKVVKCGRSREEKVMSLLPLAPLCACDLIHQQVSPVAPTAKVSMIYANMVKSLLPVASSLSRDSSYNIFVLYGNGYSVKIFLYIKGIR